MQYYVLIVGAHALAFSRAEEYSQPPLYFTVN